MPELKRGPNTESVERVAIKFHTQIEMIHPVSAPHLITGKSFQVYIQVRLVEATKSMKEISNL